jgi:hypothetical protein
VSNIYREARVHVMAERCATCIFRPGNLMELRRGRVRRMVDDAKQRGSAIACHETILGQREQEAVCRGFYELHKTPVLILAEAFGVLDEVPTSDQG